MGDESKDAPVAAIAASVVAAAETTTPTIHKAQQQHQQQEDKEETESEKYTNTTTTTTTNAVSEVVFSSVDLLREILSYLIDEPDPCLLEANTLSKSFYAALMESDRIWKSVCRYRWIQKWGFHQRWDSAIEAVASHTSTCANDDDDDNNNNNNAETAAAKWWRYQYQWQEHNAQRDYISPEELTQLTFDFRFWVMEYFWGQEHVLQSGLFFSVGSNFKFLPQHDEETGRLARQGLLDGHPSNRDDLEWFLDRDGKGLQWGKMPHLWPKAQIVRLDNWGWEIRNPNVCLRAIDPAVLLEDHLDSVDIAMDLQDLWADALASVQSYPIQLWPERGEEGIVSIEVPPVFWDFQQNRLRFPRIEA